MPRGPVATIEGTASSAVSLALETMDAREAASAAAMASASALDAAARARSASGTRPSDDVSLYDYGGMSPGQLGKQYAGDPFAEELAARRAARDAEKRRPASGRTSPTRATYSRTRAPGEEQEEGGGGRGSRPASSGSMNSLAAIAEERSVRRLGGR